MKKTLLSSFLVASLLYNAQATYTAVPKDTPYGISKKFGLTVDQLYQLNPDIKQNGLKIGDVVIVSKNGRNTGVSVDSNTKVTELEVEKGTTLYSLMREYHVSMADLQKLNPGLDENLRIGQKILLPTAQVQKFGSSQPIVQQKVETPNNTDQTSAGAQTYLVQPKDTYYKITHLYNISQKDLFAMNPGLENNGLHPGDVLNIGGSTKNEIAQNKSTAPQDIADDNDVQEASALPETETVATTTSNVQTSDDDKYKVKQGDTVFSILNRFGITLDELLTMNPQLSQGLKAGMVLTIKKTKSSPTEFTKIAGSPLNVVMLLPFSFDDNNKNYREVALDFLTGAQIAIEKNVANGKKLNVKVIDEGSEASFQNALNSMNRENTDLVIGPFFKSDVVKLMSFLSGRNVPVISPFANTDDLHQYPNLIIVDTNPTVYADKIAEEVVKSYKGEKIYIFGDKYAQNIQTNLKKNLKQADITIVKSANEISLDSNMMTGKNVPIIAILTSDQNTDKQNFMSKIVELGNEAEGNKAFSMFYDTSFERDQNKLKGTSFVYLMDRKINMEGTFEKSVLEAYKKKYCKTPSKYAVIGFDVVNDALMRENDRGQLFKQINKKQTHLATTFEYEKTKGGAYVNTGYRVVRILP